jgi:hypothetical protein
MYTQAVADEICRRLAEGETLRQICNSARESDPEFPDHSTVCGWQNQWPEFAKQYARARSEGLDVMAQEIIAIADTPQEGVKVKVLPDGKTETTHGDMLEHRRFRVDARKWLLSKMRPEKYGDRTALEHSGPAGSTLRVIVEDAAAKPKDEK